MLLDAQNPADQASAPLPDRRPRCAPPRTHDDALTDVDPSEGRGPPAEEPCQSPAENTAGSADGATASSSGEIDETGASPSDESAGISTPNHGNALEPPHSNAAAGVAPIVLGIVTASVAELTGNAGANPQATPDLAPGTALHAALVSAGAIGPAAAAGPDASRQNPPASIPPDLAPEPTPLPTESDPTAALPLELVDNDNAESSADPVAPELPPQTSASGQDDSAESDGITTPATAGGPPAAARKDGAQLNDAMPSAKVRPPVSAEPVASAAQDTAPVEPSAAPVTAGSQQASSKPPRTPPFAREGDAAPTVSAAPIAPQSSSAPPIPVAKANVQAAPLQGEAGPGNGTEGNDEPQSDLSQASAEHALLELAASPARRADASPSATPAALDAPPTSVVATAAGHVAANQNAPTTFLAAIPPAPPIALSDLPLAVALQVKNGRNRFAIRLDPPELGRIDVRLDIDSRSNVMLRLVAERPETLELLRRDAPHIERALQDAGLKTGDQALQFSLHNQSEGTDGAPPVAAHSALAQDEAVAVAIPQTYARLAGLGAGIDIRV